MAVLVKNTDGTFTAIGNGLKGGEISRGSLAGLAWGGGKLSQKANLLTNNQTNN